MINGEGAHEKPSEVASPDPLEEFLQQGQQSDGGGASPVLSQYSSCGESEFERYCSANPVMGTPSLCSSVGTFQECPDLEFSSVKGFVLDGGAENFSLAGKFSRNFGDRKLSSFGGLDKCSNTESCDGNSDAEQRNNIESRQASMGIKEESNLYGNMESSSLHELNHMVNGNLSLTKNGGGYESLIVSDLKHALDEGFCGEDNGGGLVLWKDHPRLGVMQSFFEGKSVQDDGTAEAIEDNAIRSVVDGGSYCLRDVKANPQSHMIVEKTHIGLERLSSQQFDRREAGLCSDEGENSSRYEHSEDDDSICGYGTDDEQKIDLYRKIPKQDPPETNAKNQNSLRMTSAMAFGSYDWDDFMHETGENTVESMVSGELLGRKQQIEQGHLNSGFEAAVESLGISASGQLESLRDISVANNLSQGADKLVGLDMTCSMKPHDPLDSVQAEQRDTRELFVSRNQVRGVNELTDYHFLSYVSGSELDPPREEVSVEDRFREEVSSAEMLNTSDHNWETEKQERVIREVSGVEDSCVSASQELEKTELHLGPLSDNAVDQIYLAPVGATGDRLVELPEDHTSFSLPSLSEDHPAPMKTQNVELNEFYDEVVHEMEEILLDSDNSPGARFIQGNRIYQSYIPLPSRDGGSTASTSGTDDSYPLIRHSLRIDGVEVVGARQKKGDVSLSERLVGVKEYTVYKIIVWSGDLQWEVERRYRDFYTLYRRLKTFFAEQGWILPSPWSSVQQESRKLFGNASPDVIAERSVLIQECLQSILPSRFSSTPPGALIWFLSPPKAVSSDPTSDAHKAQSPFSRKGIETENISTLGKTISLVVEIRPYKSMKQILEAQHYTCAGCHKHFDDGKTLMQEFVQTLGWGKPRLCEYSGQLFCLSCHLNETAVLPARVLHFWDFTQYPVSQLAKSYLDSIRDQPMLCVSAVNPFLFSKVSALQQVTNVRKKIGAMLPYVRCPFRRSIYRGLGSRRYLLEGNDFFALRDLIDLSKGVFAALPVMVETVSRKILEHITDQCLVCCDVGVPCNARQACDNLTSLIFPFQEGEIERCKYCQSVFHKPCFKKIASCPCGVQLNAHRLKSGTTMESPVSGSEADGTLGMLRGKSDSRSSVKFFSRLFSKERPGDARDSDTVILMGSLPSTSL